MTQGLRAWMHCISSLLKAGKERLAGWRSSFFVTFFLCSLFYRLWACCKQTPISLLYHINSQAAQQSSKSHKGRNISLIISSLLFLWLPSFHAVVSKKKKHVILTFGYLICWYPQEEVESRQDHSLLIVLVVLNLYCI